MADVVRSRSSHSKNSRGRGKDKYKDRKKDSPRKKHRFDNGRSTKVSTPKDYDRKFEDHSSSRHWEDCRDSHKKFDETVYSRPQYDCYKDESLLNNHAMLNGQINFGDRFNNHVSGEYRFNSNDNLNGESAASLKADIVDLRKQVEFFYQENILIVYL
ncbi:hypothetical protein JTE90_023882 [Oedothorax gibbosus]|uniref:Uncharacterized protein n=1 Tax=Oedothorax gibbosus TaxID=931172 RepID=A0AAV6ULV4_9ARAC|nr:hypothetical protein JTE90_023882 [Oedothorax gibbosus]